MACCLVSLDKVTWVRLIGIEETLCHAIAKLVIRAAVDQSNMVCGSVQLCAGLEAGIEGATHSMVQRRQERHALDT